MIGNKIDMLDEALYLMQEHQVCVIPVGHDKRPVTAWAEYQKSFPTEVDLMRMMAIVPNPNIAIITGALTKYRKNSRNDDGTIAPINYKILLINIASSIFISFISYWFVRDNVDSEKLAVAIAGIVSFLGADFLELFIKKKTLGD